MEDEGRIRNCRTIDELAATTRDLPAGAVEDPRTALAAGAGIH
jgi:hypothetical protein